MEELAESASGELETLVQRVRSYNPEADAALIRRAYEYSARMHGEQRRESGESFVTHPLNVALIAAELKLDVPSIVTALLHDVVEDTHAPLAEVEALFGGEIARLVDGVTKVSKVTFSSREEKQAENFRKMIIAMARDIRVVTVKLADRLHNMRTLSALAAGRQKEIARETLEIYAPIAHRLGIYWLKSELEDASFRHLNPPAYSMLKASVAKRRAEREEYIRTVIEILSRRLQEAGVRAEVTGRPKHFYSIYAKMREEGIAFDQIHDLVAFRIIVDSVRECYEALGVVHANWKPVPGRFKDYIALPKPNLYQSLHTTVIGPHGQRMEVQIRNHEMHRVAEEGIAAHWTYKEGGGEQREAEHFAWLRRLVEWQQNLKDPQEFLSTVRDDLFATEVFVFTPKGDVLDFPKGSTVIDFAYRIHSEVGNHLAGARVNGRMTPLRYRLCSGDTVEVATSERQTPGKDWADFAQSARAKSRIRQWFRQQQAERSRQLGVSLLDRELAPLKLSAAQLRNEKRLEPALKEFSQRDADALLAAVGYGIVTPAQLLAKALTPDELRLYRAEKQPAPAGPAGAAERAAREARGGVSGAVVVSGVDDMLVRFARCCNPLPGEAITGFITRGRGVTVHLAGCSHALLSDPQRCVPVVWKDGESAPRPIRLEVLCVDRPGLLAAMSKAIAASEVNITTAEVKTTGDDGRALSIFELSVTNARQLNNLMSSVAAIEGVIRVSRLGRYQNSSRVWKKSEKPARSEE